jgi:hypothetical protein
VARLIVTIGAVRGVIRELAGHAGDDPHVRAALDRLEKDTAALDAIAAIVKSAGDDQRVPELGLEIDPAGNVRALLERCLQASWQLREFHRVLGDKRRLDKSLRQNRESVADLRQLVDAATRPGHPMTDWTPLPETEQEQIERIASRPHATPSALQEQRAAALAPGNAESFRDMLDRFTDLIEQQEKVALDVVVSREATTDAAAEKAVIGWLAEQVAETFGKPHTAHVAVLAGAVLGIGKVLPSRVRDAQSAHRQKVQ